MLALMAGAQVTVTQMPYWYWHYYHGGIHDSGTK
jgi:hypothetical protein